MVILTKNMIDDFFFFNIFWIYQDLSQTISQRLQTVQEPLCVLWVWTQKEDWDSIRMKYIDILIQNVF